MTTSYLGTVEKNWCKMMKFFNPYIDPFIHRITHIVPVYDRQAYEKYPKTNFVYDKLYIAKSQNLLAGKLDTFDSSNQNIKYPIFIKPRWGHKSASSKNCFKIKNYDELKTKFNIPNMMWSQYIDGTEGMTDFVLERGEIVYQLTYKYSDKQHGYIDQWKYISPDNMPPPNVVEWIKKNIKNYTGIVNVQYRNNIIIEVSLRFARGGAYINSTKNESLIKNINNLINEGKWNHWISEKMNFEPFYSFKCYTDLPIIYLLAQYVLDYLMKKYNAKPFYEYYFEPNGKEGTVFFQFLHTNYDEGIKAKKFIEDLFNICQYISYIFIVTILISIILNYRFSGFLVFMMFFLFLTRLLNPISYNLNQIKNIKNKKLHLLITLLIVLIILYRLINF